MGNVTVTPFGGGADGGAEGVLQSVFFGTKYAGRVRRCLVAMSSSYATGGDTVPLANLGLRNVTAILLEPASILARPGFNLELAGTSAAPKLQAWETANTEVANAVDLSTRGATTVWFIGD